MPLRFQGTSESILDTIGWTPLIHLQRSAAHLAPPIYAKVETFNPGGSAKDRIAAKMIEEAERSGALKPGGTISEATADNTGLGLALVAAVKSYRCIFVMHDKMSEDRVRLLRAFGAEVVITPTNVPTDSSEIHVGQEPEPGTGATVPGAGAYRRSRPGPAHHPRVVPGRSLFSQPLPARRLCRGRRRSSAECRADSDALPGHSARRQSPGRALGGPHDAQRLRCASGIARRRTHHRRALRLAGFLAPGLLLFPGRAAHRPAWHSGAICGASPVVAARPAHPSRIRHIGLAGGPLRRLVAPSGSALAARPGEGPAIEPARALLVSTLPDGGRFRFGAYGFFLRCESCNN